MSRAEHHFRAQHHFRDLFLLLLTHSEGTTVCSFPPSILYLLGFHRLENQVSLCWPRLLLPPPQPYQKPREGIYTRRSLQRIPSLVPVERWFALAQLHAAQKLLSALPPAQAAVRSLLLPHRDPSRHCLHPGHVPALLLLGSPWSCHPVVMPGAAPLSPSHGADSCQQLNETNISTQRHLSSYYCLSFW